MQTGSHSLIGGLSLRVAALCGLTAPCLIVASVFIAAAVTPGYSHMANTVSQLGAWHRPHPWIMNSGFVIFGGLMTILACGLHRQIRGGRASLLTQVALSIFGLGIILAGIFQDGPQGADNLESDLHSIFAMAGFFGLVTGMVCLALAARGKPEWRGFARLSLIVAAVDLLFSLLFMLEALSPIEGLLQRLFYAPSLAWIFAVSWRLLYLSSHPSGTHTA